MSYYDNGHAIESIKAYWEEDLAELKELRSDVEDIRKRINKRVLQGDMGIAITLDQILADFLLHLQTREKDFEENYDRHTSSFHIFK